MLVTIVAKKLLLNNLEFLKKFFDTDNIEAFHSLYNKYCTKRLDFHYNGMIGRLQVAILGNDSGIGLKQGKTKNGRDCFKQVHSKITESWCVKRVLCQKSCCNIEDLETTHCTKNMTFPIKDFFSKCDQIRRKLWIWSHLLKKFLMKNFIFCAVTVTAQTTKIRQYFSTKIETMPKHIRSVEKPKK